MARQVDAVSAVLAITRNPDGSYSSSLVDVTFTVNNPVATKIIDGVPVSGNLSGLVKYDGAKTLDDFLTDALNVAEGEI